MEKQQLQPSQVYTSEEGEVLDEERTVTVPPSSRIRHGAGSNLSHQGRGNLSSCKRGNVSSPVPLMVGQASSPDIMMTSGDACPTNEWEKRVGGRSGGGAELLQRTSDFEIPHHWRDSISLFAKHLIVY